MATVFKDKVVVLITGASQNVGAAIAHSFAAKMAPGSLLILSSRSADRLSAVRQDILKSNDKIKVALCEWDLKKPNAEQYRKDLINAIGGDLASMKTAIIVHNAFQLGNMSKHVSDMTDPAEIQEQLNINVVSALTLNAVWLNVVKPIDQKFVCNVTAPSATKSLPSFSLTTLAKAPVYMVLNVLAKEMPEVRVMHFDPGLVDTDGLRTIRDESHYAEIRNWIKSAYDKGELLTTEQTSNALVKALEANKFESGEIVSAFNVVAGKC